MLLLGSGSPDARLKVITTNTIHYDNVLEYLLQAVPEFKVTYEENLQETYGELLLHYLFADLTRFTALVCDDLKNKTGRLHNPADILSRIMDFLETAAQSDDREVVSLVAVSFLEHLPKPGIVGKHGAFIKSQLGPETKKLLEAVDRFWDGK
jgi:hypothetical protein